ncbi:MAG TPA: hypothetical protein VHE54_15775 [Puia sp.]|nr:hypothetical protein [Puia sp.]
MNDDAIDAHGAKDAHAAKLRFSPEEIRLVTDASWILTKNSVMEKVVRMMAVLSEVYRGKWEESQIHAMDPGSPKISRGENYQGLPWIMLDYPRIFGRDEVLAIRTMFWWGHSFIVTLHLKGRYRELCLPALEKNAGRLEEAGFHIGITEDEWRHEHALETYRPLAGAGDLATGLPFLKLSAALPVDRWEEATGTLAAWFTLLVRTLASYQGDERGLSPGSSRAGSDL